VTTIVYAVSRLPKRRYAAHTCIPLLCLVLTNKLAVLQTAVDSCNCTG